MSLTIPMLQVRGKSAVIYDRYMGPTSAASKLRRQLNMSQQRTKAYSGLLTEGNRKRLAKAISLLVQSAKPVMTYNPVTNRMFLHKLSFVTLTVSSSTRLLKGKEAYNLLLKPFLQWLTKTKKVTTYFWKAELQQRGQIHYHITSPSFIHYKEIRNKWNYLQQKAGLLDGYYKKKGHYNPNSTDIHGVKKVNNLEAYLMKYMLKQYQNASDLEGKLWDCSRNLKDNQYFTVICERHHSEYFDLSEQLELCRHKKGDRFSLYMFSKVVTEYLLQPHELTHYRDFLEAIRNGVTYVPKPSPS